MPELPDVETYKRYLDATALHKEIIGVEVRSRILLEETQVRELEGGLRGQSFESTHRHGKWLFVELADAGWLVLHFGMSGRIQYFRDMEKDPSYDRFLVTFANGYHLAYVAARKLGEIEIIEDPQAFVQDKGLGPDVLAPDFGVEAFLALLAERRGMIKPALMDQQLLAGIGNVYSDEILFQARVHPRTEIDQLDTEKRKEIYVKMQEVLRTAIGHQARPAEFPDSFIIPHRDAQGACPVCGNAVAQVKVSGRTAYYCPNRQGSEP
jgi:formamidopyrimidine-DNA glycosylase